jgi:hypothetical protein
MLWSKVAGAGGTLGGGGVGISLVDERLIQTSNTSTFTFTDVAFGANTQKHILIFCTVADPAASTTGGSLAVDIDGESAESLVLQSEPSRQVSRSAFSLFTSLLSGDVVVTTDVNVNVDVCIIAVYEITGLEQNLTVVSDTDSGATPLSGSVQRPTGESIVACFASGVDSTDTVVYTVTSTTATQDGTENSSVLSATYASGVSTDSGTENFSIAFTGGSSGTPGAIFLSLQ